jgi:glycosyltransferase involved in cell wall biosynthesis
VTPAAGSSGRRVVIVQGLIPDYRVGFYTSLRERLGDELVVVSGEDDFAVSIDHVASMSDVLVRNRFLLRRRLLWQSGAVTPAVRADVAVLLLNPRVLTMWVILLARRVLRRRTVLWGHAWPREGRESRTDRLRGTMRRLADTLIVYTDTEARELRAHMRDPDVVAAPNSLYSAAELDELMSALGEESFHAPPSDFVCTGRLIEAKKPALLLEAFVVAEPDLPDDTRLVFIGDGPLREPLESRAEDAGLASRVRFLGHVNDARSLAAAYATAMVAVSPGYVGLSLIQSLGFGVPMLIARDEPHAPEVEAAVDLDAVSFFPSDSTQALAEALVAQAAARAEIRARRAELASLVRSRYTIDAMVEGFVAALDPATRRTYGTTRIAS